MTQTQIVCDIITNRRPWRVLDSAGREVPKPQGRNELETLLILHKSGIRVEATGPGMEHNPVSASGGLAFGGHDTSPDNKERWDMTPEETH